MEHYKSWAGLNKQLTERLCAPLKGRVTYFLTRYREVHNSYGRAAVLLDGQELVQFSWVEMYEQDIAMSRAWYEDKTRTFAEIEQQLKLEWDKNGTYCEMNFLAAATAFLNMPIAEALISDDLIVRIFAVMDGRTGKRTLQKMKDDSSYLSLPEWLRQFYELRFQISGI